MKRLVSYTALVLVIAQVVLILVSWLLSATMTEGVRSLLATEGIRWYFGQFTTMLASPWLVWLLLLSMAWGAVRGRRLRGTSYRERVALRITLILLLLYIAVIVLLTAVPHAVLLSATGSLFPSAFSHALVPLVAFGIILMAITYGAVSGHFHSLVDVVFSLTSGIASAAPLFLLYVLLQQFIQSLRFVFF